VLVSLAASEVTIVRNRPLAVSFLARIRPQGRPAIRGHDLACAVLALALAGCGAHAPESHVYRPPVAADDGLAVGTLTEVGCEAAPLLQAARDISEGRFGEIHSLLLLKDGRLVFEAYFPGHDYAWDAPGFQGATVDWDQDTAHNVHSVGKSITSACVGIAIDKGFIGGVDASIWDYLPEHRHLNTEGKDRITIEHLLAMTSGLEWDEWGASYKDANNDVIAMWVESADPIAYVLAKPMVSDPGAEFNYSGGNMVVLGEIIRNATGMDIEAFSGAHLFAPLGIDPPEWSWINDSVVYAGGDQRMTPREMLILGAAFLNQGVWGGERVLSQAWVGRSASPYPGPDHSWLNHALRPIPPGEGTWGRRGYSYGWWVHTFGPLGRRHPAYWAFGWGGQRIIVLPEHEAVVVFTAANYARSDPTLRILTQYVLPALERG